MRTEPQRLHSLQSIFLKTAFPVLWIGGFVAATIALFSGSVFTGGSAAPPPLGMKWMFLGATLAGAAFIYWSCIRLKLVRMDHQRLYISNLVTEIEVPLSQIEGVTDNRWLNTHPVTIQLRDETAFGRTIVFMPRIRWFLFWNEHPVVDEILEAVRLAKGGIAP